MNPKHAIIAGLVAAAAGNALAATEVDERRPIEAGATVNFEAVSGHVSFVEAGGSELVITGQLADHVRELSINGDASDWSIEVELEDTDDWNWSERKHEQTSLRIELPADINLEVETVSGNITITGMSSEYMDLESVSGTIELSASRVGALDAESVSGNIVVESGTIGEADLSSVSGNIRARELSGSVSVETVSGNATVGGEQLDEADFETVSGSFDLDLGMNPVSELNLSSHSGDITAALPAGLPLRLNAETFSGRLINEFAPDNGGRSRNGDHLSYTVGEGTAEVDAESFSGTIRIRTR